MVTAFLRKHRSERQEEILEELGRLVGCSAFYLSRQFSEAMSRHPRVFDTIFVSLIRAGEQSGQLPEVFKSLADNINVVPILTLY